MCASIKKFVLVTCAFVCLAEVSFAQSDVKYDELPNFHKVNEQLYRGAQPKRGGINQLARLGIKTIVNLRADNERTRAEAQEARAAGLRYFNVPLERLGRPTDEQVASVLTILADGENQPVFLHCQHGVDRTGTVIAIYRIERDGWTSKDAKAEANRYGMKWWQRGKKDYIRDYHRRRQEHIAPVLVPRVSN